MFEEVMSEFTSPDYTSALRLIELHGFGLLPKDAGDEWYVLMLMEVGEAVWEIKEYTDELAALGEPMLSPSFCEWGAWGCLDEPWEEN